MRASVAAVLTALCVSACRPTVFEYERASNTSGTEATASTTPSADAHEADAALPENAPPRPPGPLTRVEALAIVNRGLGAFLARVTVTPMFRAGQFVGFRLDSARDLEEWRASGVDLRVGDLLVRINGIRVERPEQALWAFERLRIAEAIEVEGLRNGAPLLLRSPILGEPIVPPARTP